MSQTTIISTTPISRYPDNTWYYLRSDLGTVLDVKHANNAIKAEVWMYYKNGTLAQHWRLTTEGYLENALGNILDVKFASKTPYSRVWMFHKNGTSAQKWVYTSDGYLSAATNSSLVLDVEGANFRKEAKLWMHEKNGTCAQKWKFEPISSDGDDVNISNECCICLENLSNYALVPCGHKCVCEEDAQKLLIDSDVCPVCRSHIDNILEVF
jgi:hypothetical protein